MKSISKIDLWNKPSSMTNKWVHLLICIQETFSTHHACCWHHCHVGFHASPNASQSIHIRLSNLNEFAPPFQTFFQKTAFDEVRVEKMFHNPTTATECNKRKVRRWWRVVLTKRGSFTVYWKWSLSEYSESSNAKSQMQMSYFTEQLVNPLSITVSRKLNIPEPCWWLFNTDQFVQLV